VTLALSFIWIGNVYTLLFAGNIMVQPNSFEHSDSMIAFIADAFLAAKDLSSEITD